MIEQLVIDVFKRIALHNAKVHIDAIPHSDLFAKEIAASFGIETHDVARIIRILHEAHKIFIIEITKEDKENDVKRVEGYVETEMTTIRTLKNFFQTLLMDEYEKQFRRRVMVHQIAKEVYSKPGIFKNTILGMIANKAIMLDEYENLLTKEFNLYSDLWKSRRLNELLESTNIKLAEKDMQQDLQDRSDGDEGERGQRAVDTELFSEYSQARGKLSIDKVLQIYGVEFFFRVNLRKCNFDLLRQVLESGVINRKADLAVLKNMIQRMKANMDRDPCLADHLEDIHKLERILSRSMLYGA